TRKARWSRRGAGEIDVCVGAWCRCRARRGRQPPAASRCGTRRRFTGDRVARGAGAVYCDATVMTDTTTGAPVSLLAQISGPADVRKLSREQLPQLAQE